MSSDRSADGRDWSVHDRVWAVLRPSEAQWDDWRWHWRHRITTADALATILPLTDGERQEIARVARNYPFSITPYYLSLAETAACTDPILRQAMPVLDELGYAGCGEEDPLSEQADSPVPGLVHRYPDRALLVITDICPLLCRHCTRKREWRAGNWVRSRADLARAFEYIRATPALRDIIISGGDPLSLANARLAGILAELRSIPHVEIIRLGTRYPVVLPQRIDAELCDVLDRYGPIWLMTHFNHPNEVTREAGQAVRALLRAGVPVNNQCVLLRGINDSVDVQKRLNQALLQIRVRPYYLYHADQVRGTEHLRTSVESGVRIVEGLRGYTSGLAIPTFVVDVPGGGGKVPIQPNYVVSWSEHELLLRNYENLVFRYRNPQPRDGAAEPPRLPRHDESQVPAAPLVLQAGDVVTAPLTPRLARRLARGRLR